MNITFMETEEPITKTVFHFAYQNWPDFGVPRSIPDFLHLMNDVNEKRTQMDPSLQHPIVVHCRYLEY